MSASEEDATKTGGAGCSARASVRYAQEKARALRAKPWQVHGPRDVHIARVGSHSEGVALAEVVGAVGGRLVGQEPKAMRATVRRMADDLQSGQSPLPLGDGWEGWKRDV